MKKAITFILGAVLILTLCSCMRRGPYSPPLHQSHDQVIRVELVDGRNEAELFKKDSYNDFVLFSFNSAQTASFMDELMTIDFFLPGWEPSRHLGEIAVRIYYEDGSSELIGSNCNYYFNSNFEIVDWGIYYPDRESFYALCQQYVDPSILPQRQGGSKE